MYFLNLNTIWEKIDISMSRRCIDIFSTLVICLLIVKRQTITITVKSAFVYHGNEIKDSTTFNVFGQRKNKQILQTTES